MNSNRYGDSRAAYREVQERHEDIKRIERTMVELAQLFNDVRFYVYHVIPCLILLRTSDEYHGRTTR
jgi:t-SNARE complex subunit (syntaxin)